MTDDFDDFFYSSAVTHGADEKITDDSILPWKVLIVDDDESVHTVTNVALSEFLFDNKPLELVHAYSVNEAKREMNQHTDIALVLLDVVMETDDAGLNVVKFIREELGNKNVRIILRTGQPGQAPEKEIVNEYDINDYKEKSDLTVIKLYTAVVSALRSFRDIRTIDANKVGLEKIIDASASLFEIRSAETLISGMLDQLVSIFHLSQNSFFCNFLRCKNNEDNDFPEIIAGTGEYKKFVGNNKADDIDPEIVTIIKESCQSKVHIYKKTHSVIYFKNDDLYDSMLYIGGCTNLTEWEINLLEIFCANASIAIKNIRLYEKQTALTEAYSSFVPKDFLTLLDKDSIIDVSLGDHTQQNMSVLFADIRSFSGISEKLTPQDSFNFLNEYLSYVGPVIRKNNGFIDKYIGDAIMAIFPKSSEDAIQAALDMHSQLFLYNQKRVQENKDEIRIGIGIHSGSLMLGTIGETERMEGTVISDGVNLASRLESLTKKFNSAIIVSQEALHENQSKFNQRLIGRVNLKGKEKTVLAYELFDCDDTTLFKHKKDTKTMLEQGIEHYYNKNFSGASECFIQVIKDDKVDSVAAAYLKQSTYYMLNELPDDWDGSLV